MRLWASFVTRIKTSLPPKLEIQIEPLSGKERKLTQISDMNIIHDRWFQKQCSLLC